MSTKDMDDALFVALLRGDEERVGILLNLVGAMAIRTVRTRRFRSGNHCMAGESAEDVVSDAKLKFLKKFLEAARSDTLKPASFVSYFIRIVDNTCNDLYRRGRRSSVCEAVTHGHDDGTDADGERGAMPAYPSRPWHGAPHAIEDVADTSPTPEDLLVAQQTAEQAVEHEFAQLYAVYRQWCEWPDHLLPYCNGTAPCPVAPGKRGGSPGSRPALVSVLNQMTAYLRSKLLSCQVSAAGRTGDTLLDLLDTADVRRLAASLLELNAVILAALDISRMTLDQRWADLKAIGRKHGIPHPPGLFMTRHRARRVQTGDEPEMWIGGRF